MRKPWVWLLVALFGVGVFIVGGVAQFAFPALQHDGPASAIFNFLCLSLIFITIPVGLIGAVICCFLKPKVLNLPYASKARGFEVGRRGE